LDINLVVKKMMAPNLTFHGMKEERMDIKRSLSVVMILAVAAGMLVIPAGSAMADEQVQTRSMIRSQDQVDEATQLRLRLKNQICNETGLTEEEVEAIEPLMAEALELNGGETEPIRKMVRKAVQVDCVGECLAERLRTQNMLMLKEQQAADGEKIMAREQLTTRTRTRDGEQSGGKTRSETRTQSRDRSGSGSGSGGGSGR
jgi:hypothetical protein